MRFWIWSIALFLGTLSWAQFKDLPFGSPTSFAEFHGFIDLEYTSLPDQPDSFDNHHFYFLALAQVSEHLSFLGEIEYEHAGEELKVDRAYMQWKPNKNMGLRFGKFYTPFGYEIKEYQAPLNKLVSRPLIKDLLWDEWADVGIEMFMTHPHFSVDFALVNGPSGLGKEDQQARDNNDDKFFVGRVEYHPFITAPFYVGASYATGKVDEKAMQRVSLWGMDVRYTQDTWDLRGEYLERHSDLLVNDEKGYYIQGSFAPLHGKRYIHRLDLIYRYAKRESDFLGSEENHSFGVNYAPYPHFHWKVEYQAVDQAGDTFHRFFSAVVLDF